MCVWEREREREREREKRRERREEREREREREREKREKRREREREREREKEREQEWGRTVELINFLTDTHYHLLVFGTSELSTSGKFSSVTSPWTRNRHQQRWNPEGKIEKTESHTVDSISYVLFFVWKNKIARSSDSLQIFRVALKWSPLFPTVKMGCFFGKTMGFLHVRLRLTRLFAWFYLNNSLKEHMRRWTASLPTLLLNFLFDFTTSLWDKIKQRQRTFPKKRIKKACPEEDPSPRNQDARDGVACTKDSVL